jgi:CheY-like chemotaxis protein
MKNVRIRCDLPMPLMDGAALIHTLQKLKPDVRVIASQGRRGQEGCTDELPTLNGRASLTQPYQHEQLLTTLRQALKPQTNNRW